MATQLANATVMVNNVQVAIMPNTVVFTDGFGEQSMKVASVGGGEVEQIFAENIETNLSMVKFDMPSIIDNIDNQRAWKVNKNLNVVQITGSTPEGVLSRTFTQAALLNEVEVALGTDVVISIEFKSNPAI